MQTSNFKLIFIGIFAAAAVFGVLVFSGIIKLGGGSVTTATAEGSATIWGTFPTQAIAPYVSEFNLKNEKVRIQYVEKDKATFDAVLVEAMATGNAPDLVILPDDLAWRFADKVTHIPFASLPAQTFASTFISSSSVYSATDGIIAMPWASDPLVMYYNRDLLQNIGVAQPPATWQAFSSTIPLLTAKQSDLTLTQMGAALGSYKNLAHPKQILALLFLESGSKFVTAEGNRLRIHFGPSSDQTESSASVSAMNFFMGFSNPQKDVYTWNQGQPLDRDAFIQSRLAYYFGKASELPLIRAQNPNLNFGITLPPQSPTGTTFTTGGMYGLAIPKTAKNQLLSYTAATLMASPAMETALVTKTATTLALMPVRRDVLAKKPVSDPYLGFLFDAALVQRAWIDPNPMASDQVFNTLIRDIASGTLAVEAALTKAAAQLNALSAKI